MTAVVKDKPAAKEQDKKPKGPSPNHPRPRKGKTLKDKRNGAKAKNEENKGLRGDWRNQGNGKRSLQDFPYSTCNGKRNLYQYTGKGGQTIYTRTPTRKG
jgi:hypothetical protein